MNGATFFKKIFCYYVRPEIQQAIDITAMFYQCNYSIFVRKSDQHFEGTKQQCFKNTDQGPD